MQENQINFEQIANHLPPEWKDAEIRTKIRKLNRTLSQKIVVLDDDPTGVQTVHDILVLTQWNKELLLEAFQHPEHVFFILTNTRGMEASEAARINLEIAANVLAAAGEKGYKVQFVSRSDSTLRGHYPLEIDILSEETERITGQGYDGHLIVPAFFEAGRYTYHNVHYLKEGELLTPAHQTEFAKDKVFGFSHSELREWVEEKTDGRFRPEDCVSISVEEIRRGPDAVEAILTDVTGNQPVIVNAMSYRDLEVLSMALLQAASKGKRFIYRTAASFVKAFGGISDIDYLSAEQMVAKGKEHMGGLVIVGSHMQKTTRQLENLINGTAIVPLEMEVGKILNDGEREQEIGSLIGEVNRTLQSGRNVVVFSSRKLVAVEGKAANLKISQRVSSSLVKIVETLEAAPKFIVAKGGITSSDVATKGLKIKKATVLGQAAPAIPVWLTGEDAKFPYMPYIIFPGNVGGDETLMEVVKKISG
ncbi:four-carbon acid sugar kinase family protein [Ferviditalea candida]|uniref:Four-carbon acid sugar kinase family protein n=1 Tax=Ferviditalea candida TaxID=3108399 RepID=A0ABU5ZGT3_9BACL|nr:four-carbon acid sugar kinase family protein [Paenibacillaceae bacterium T2]